MRSSHFRGAIKLALLTLVPVGGIAVFFALQKSPLDAGLAAYEDGQYATAAGKLERAAKDKRVSLDVLLKLAKSWELIKQFDRAAETYATARERFPEEPDLARFYGEMLVLDGDADTPPCERAETFGREFIQDEANNTNPCGYYILGKAMVHRYHAQWKAFRERIRTSYDGPNVWFVLNAVERCLASENYAAAREELGRGLERGANVSAADPIYETVANMHHVQEEAIRCLTRAEGMAGDDGHASIELTKFLNVLDRKKKAEQRARSLLRTPATRIDDAVKIEAHEVLANILESGALGDERQLREAAAHWAHFIVGLKELPLTAHERAIKRYQALNARGRIGVRMKDAKICFEVADSFLNLDEHDSSGLFFRGMGFYFDENLREAESDLITSLNKRTDFTAHMTLGQILVKLGEEHYSNAISHFRKAEHLQPNSWEPSLARIRLAVAQKHFLDASRMLDKLIKNRTWTERVPDSAYELRDELQIALLKRDKDVHFESVEDARRAWQVNPRDRYANYYLATHHYAAKEYAKALPFARRLNASARQQMLSYLLLIKVLIGLKNYDEAAELLLETDELDPTDGRPIALAAQLAKLHGDGRKHWSLVNRAVQLDPRNWKLRYEVASILWGARQTDSARHHLDIAMRNVASPPYEMLRLDVDVRIAAGQGDDALAALERLRAHPDANAADIAYFRGRLAELRDNIPEAVAVYEEGLSEYPDSAELITNLAKLYKKQNDRNAAFELLERFYKSGGRAREATAELADYYLEDWKLEAARAAYLELRRIAWGDARAFLGLGKTALYLDEPNVNYLMDMMRPFLRGSIQNEPQGLEKTVELLLAVSYGFLRSGNWKIAVSRLKELERFFKGSEFRNQALLAYFKGDRPYARHLVDKGLAAKPAAPVLRFLRALLNRHDGDYRMLMADIHVLTPEIEPKAPWRDYANAVATARPGFGRLILATCGEVLLREGRVDEAAEVLRVAAQAYPRDAEIALLFGHVRRRQNDVAGALEMFNAGRKAPDGRAIRDAGILLALAQDPKCLPLLEEYAKTHPEEGSPLLTWGRFEVGGKQLTEVLRTLRQSTRWKWDLTDDVLLTGLSYIVDGPEGALGQVPSGDSLAGELIQDLLTRGRDTDLKFAALWRDLVRGIVLGRVPLYHDAAMRHLESARSVDPAHPLFVDLVARQRLAARDADGAAELYDAMKETPKTKPLKLLGQAHVAVLRGGDPKDAIALFSQVIALKPRTSEPFRGFASLLINKGDVDAAAKLLTHAIPLVSKPVDPLLHGYRGIALEKLRDLTGATEAYLQAIEFAPDNVRLVYRAIRALLATKKYFEALTLYKQHPVVQREYPDIGLSLGLSLYNFGQQQLAAGFLKEFPYSPEAAHCLGLIHESADEEDAAIQQFELAFNLDPAGHADSLIRVIDIYRKQFKPRQALAAVKRLLRYHRQHPKAIARQAELLESLMQHDEALFAHMQAWKLAPKDPKPLLSIVRILREKGETAGARHLLSELERRMHELPPKMKRAVQRERLLLGH